MNKNLKAITISAVIAALYAALTVAGAALAYGPVQFRFSEALTVLPVFTPFAVPGLAVGCLIANIFSFNAIDMLFGTLATLTAAILTRATRKIKIKGFPVLSMIFPVIINAFVVGLEISFFYLDGFTVMGFLISALEVGIGELAVCYILGLPLFAAIKKTKMFKYL